MILLYLIQKECKQFLRNTILPVVCFLLPIALMNIVPRIATQEVKGLNFAVVDADHSPSTSRLIQKIDASTYLSLSGVYHTYSEAMRAISDGTADLILEFEPRFEANLMRTGTARIHLSANATNGTKGAMAQSYITQIILDYAQSLSPALSVQTPTVRFLFNTHLDYKRYMIPAIFALMLILIVGFLPALNIVGEKERGTIEQINVTPIGKLSFILSKIIPYVLVGMIMVAEALMASRALYGITPRGSIASIYVVSLLFCALVSSLGLIVSNFSSSIRQAALLMFFFLVIFILLSGLLTPVTSMPQWAQHITRVNPMRYFIEAMRAIFIKGSSLSQLSKQVLSLATMTVIAWTAALLSYKKSH